MGWAYCRNQAAELTCILLGYMEGALTAGKKATELHMQTCNQ